MTFYVNGGQLCCVTKANCPDCHGTGFKHSQKIKDGHVEIVIEECRCIKVEQVKGDEG